MHLIPRWLVVCQIYMFGMLAAVDHFAALSERPETGCNAHHANLIATACLLQILPKSL